MSQQQLLSRVVASLDDLNIAWMLTGSLASSLQGEPRSTHDIDVIVSLESSVVKQLVDRFPTSEFYLNEASVREAILHQGMFNLLDFNSGEKVDFWILKDDEFDKSRFARRIADTIDDIPVMVSTPEDTILMKLRWSIDSGGSSKQYLDALRVYELQAGMLDREYLRHWVSKLGLTEIWERLIVDARPL